MRGCRSVEGERRGEKGSKCSRIRARTGRKDRRLASVSLLMMYSLFFRLLMVKQKTENYYITFLRLLNNSFFRTLYKMVTFSSKSRDDIIYHII